MWRHGTGGLALEGGREEQKEALVATVAFVLPQKKKEEMSDYVMAGRPHSLMICTAMQSRSF